MIESIVVIDSLESCKKNSKKIKIIKIKLKFLN